MEKNFNLETLAGGGFTERVNQAIKEVMDNIADPNTEWKDKRKITVNLTFTTGPERDITQMDILVTPKLAPRKLLHTKVLIDRNMDGEIIGSEFRKQIPGQQTIKVDSETGEIISNHNEEEKKSEETPNLDGIRLVK